MPVEQTSGGNSIASIGLTVLWGIPRTHLVGKVTKIFQRRIYFTGFANSTQIMLFEFTNFLRRKFAERL